MVDPNRWQPLDLVRSVTKNGIDLGAQTQRFLAPGWNAVTPFALVKPTPITVLLDPGPPPLFGTETESEYIRQAIEVIQASALLDPNDGATIDVSPGAARQNNPFLTQNGQGHPLNPFTGQPYPPNVVKRGDYFRITSEFWSDGPGIEGPPGVWNMLHNEVTDDPRFERRLGGVGPLLSQLEWDVHAYLAINGALHDAAIATWTIKAKYDYVRPISMIRYLASLGQSTDPDAARYHPSGLPLIPGSIELITAATAAPGGKHAHLAAHEGEIALRCWLGVPADPRAETAGVGWKRAADWTPYHLRTFPTPNFAGYVSGHSVFSRAGAEAMALLTGSPFFPGGLKEIHFAKGKALQVEYGPSEDLTVQVATYYAAADLTGKARIYCGVHIEADDFNGRKIGARVGTDAFLRMLALRGGRSDGLQDALAGFANGAGLPQAHLTEFVFVGNSGLPIQQLRRRSEIASDSPPGIYPIATDDVSQFAIMAKGQPVSFIDARGSVGGDQRLHLDFRIETDEPVYLLARAFGDNGPLEASEMIAFEITPDGIAEVARNADWIEDQRASTAVSFLNRRDLSNTDLPSGQPALSLILSRGAYRVELAADDAAVAPARLQLEVVNDTP